MCRSSSTSFRSLVMPLQITHQQKKSKWPGLEGKSRGELQDSW
jgi:hypothetical protein